jgi:hypothetical protein
VEGVNGWLIDLGVSPSGIRTEKYD